MRTDRRKGGKVAAKTSAVHRKPPPAPAAVMLDPVAFFSVLRRDLRKRVGRRLSAVERRWRNTRSAEDETTADRCAPPPATKRFLRRYGYLEEGDTKKETAEKYARLLSLITRGTGEAPGVAAAWLEFFARGGEGGLEEGLCGKRPACVSCPLASGCRFAAGGVNRQRLSAKTLTNLLAASNQDGEPDAGAAALLSFICEGADEGLELVQAEALLRTLGGLRGLFDCKPDELTATGLSPTVAARLAAVGALCGRWVKEDRPQGKKMYNAQNVFDHFYLRLREKKREIVGVLALDEKNRVLAEELVSEGSLTETLVHPREIFNFAVKVGAAGLVVVHNHPSGDPTPSRQDRQITRRLRDAAKLLGIPLRDHLVIGDGVWYSFSEHDFL